MSALSENTAIQRGALAREIASFHAGLARIVNLRARPSCQLEPSFRRSEEVELLADGMGAVANA